MKILKQFGIILLITFVGEVLKTLLPLPIPASIYGMVILLIALISGVLKLESVKLAGDFMIEIMPILFVPAAVGLLDSWGQLKPILIPAAVITVVITVLVMVVTGRVTQAIIHHEKVGSKHE
ncbi:MAG: CidA/LrgA family protein [Clostridia bacterium]|nr:CidA/LrgA family protein [Clostridia bacterium]